MQAIASSSQGTYDEHLTIDKPIELVGDGERSDVVIQSANTHSVSCSANGVALTNLTIRQIGGRDWHAIDVASGSTIVEGCNQRVVVSGHRDYHHRSTPPGASPRAGSPAAGEATGGIAFRTSTGKADRSLPWRWRYWDRHA